MTKADARELDFSEAKKRVVYWISKKDYSESELVEKLGHWANPDVVSHTINWCHDLKLIPLPATMAENIVQSLNRQKKGIQQINLRLEKKGLAPIVADDDVELEKAIELINKKLSHSLKSETWKSLTYEDKLKTKAKAFRFLATRGFTSEIINTSFEQWLQNNKETDVYENE